MKQFILFILTIILVSCSTEEATDNKIPEKEEVLIEIKDGKISVINNDKLKNLLY